MRATHTSTMAPQYIRSTTRLVVILTCLPTHRASLKFAVRDDLDGILNAFFIGHVKPDSKGNLGRIIRMAFCLRDNLASNLGCIFFG